MPVLGLAVAFAALASSSPATVATQSVSMPAPQSVEQYVREYFADEPVMAEIAKCESRFRQFDTQGHVLKNPTSSARGVFQVLSYLHGPTIKSLGMDVYTLEDNVAFANYLYEKDKNAGRSGFTPWAASKSCWSKSAAYQAYVAGKQVAINK